MGQSTWNHFARGLSEKPVEGSMQVPAPDQLGAQEKLLIEQDIAEHHLQSKVVFG